MAPNRPQDGPPNARITLAAAASDNCGRGAGDTERPQSFINYDYENVLL